MKQVVKALSISLLVFLFSFQISVFSEEIENTGSVQFYEYIKKDMCYQASDEAFNNAVNHSSDTELYSSIFKLLYSYYSEDYIDNLQEKTEKLSNNENITKNHQAANLLKNIVLANEFSYGNFSKLDTLVKKLGWIADYDVIGPFQYNGLEDFNKLIFPDKMDSIKNSNENRLKWFNASISKDGELPLSSLFQRYSEEAYFVRSYFKAEKEGKYTFYFTKTGFTEVLIDETSVMKDSNRSSNFPGLYVVTADLKPGVHRILIKTAENRNKEAAIGVQIFDADKNPVVGSASIKGYAPQGNISSEFKLGFNIEESMKSDNDEILINNALILYITGLYQSKTNYITKSLAKIKSNSKYYSYARYLMAVSERSYENKDFYLSASLNKDPDNGRALFLLFTMKLQSGFVNQADEVLRKLEKRAPYSIAYLMAKTYMYIELGWEYEAKQIIKKIKDNNSEAIGLSLEAYLYKQKDDYRQLTEIYRKLFRKDNSSETYAENILNYSKYFLSNKEIIDEGMKFVSIFPNNMYLLNSTANRLKYADENYRALALLTNAEKKCPYNAFTYFYLSQIFERLNKNNLSRHYLKKSSLLEPGDRFLKQYHETIYGKEEPLEKYVSDVDIESLSKKADSYDTEPAVMLLKDVVEKVYADGSTTKRVRKVYKVYDPDNAKSVLQQYFIINAGEDDIVAVSSSVSYDGAAAGSGSIGYQNLTDPESRLYYDMGAVIFNFSNIRKGAVIQIDYTIHSDKGKIYKGSYGTKEYFDNEFRILQASSKVVTPLSKELYFKIYNSEKIKSTIKKEDAEKIYTFSVVDQDPEAGEPSRVPFSHRIPSVTITGFKNWKSFYDWYRPLFLNQMVVSDQMKKDIDKLVKDAATDEEKVKLVYGYITDRTRYVGFEMGIGGIKPRRTDVTYQTKLGDCKDIALLLTSIYNYLGIEAKLALVKTSDRGATDKNIAYMGAFNHAICYVNINGGMFLDGTVQKAGIKELVSADRGVNSLVVDDEGFEFITVDGSKYAEEITASNNTVTIGSNGSAIISRVIVKSGTGAIRTRHSITELKKFYTSIVRSWNSLYPGAKIGSFSVASKKINTPVSYTYKVGVQQFAIKASDELYIPLLIYKYDFYSDYALTSERLTDIYIEDDVTYKNKIVFKLPRGYKPSVLPESVKYSYGENTTEIDVKYDEDANIVTVKYDVVFKRGTIAVNEYSAFREYLLKIAAKETEKIVLEKSK